MLQCLVDFFVTNTYLFGGISRVCICPHKIVMLILVFVPTTVLGQSATDGNLQFNF